MKGVFSRSGETAPLPRNEYTEIHVDLRRKAEESERSRSRSPSDGHSVGGSVGRSEFCRDFWMNVMEMVDCIDKGKRAWKNVR